MSRLVPGFVAAALLSTLGCTDSTAPQFDSDLLSLPAAMAISDGAHGGAAGFFFLPPLVKEAEYHGTFDPARDPEVRIACTGASGPSCPILRSFSGPDIAVDTEGESYGTVWKAGETTGLEPGPDRYRLEVHEGGQLLGFIDLWLLDSGSERREVQPGYAPVLARAALAIRFRIEGSVSPPNAPPVANDDSYETDAGSALSGNVLENDTDPDPLDVLSAILETGPSNGTLALDPDGSFLYTPDPGFDGEDVFTYQATDGDLTSEPATVRITVHPVTTGPLYRPLALGSGHSCMLDDEGRAWCWGQNNWGQLGNGNAPNLATNPTEVVGGHRFVHLAAGLQHTCALDADGGAYCWGWNLEGQLGSGGTAHGYVPIAVVGGHTFRQLATTMSSTCGLKPDGTAWCWGRYVLGHETITFSMEPLQVSTDLRFVRLSGGGGGGPICGLVDGGQAYCWGTNGTGQYGDGSNITSQTPVLAAGGLLISDISVAHGFHTCSVTLGGVSYCWGRNNNGELGVGDFVQRLTPVLVAGDPTFRDVEAAYYHTCALDTEDAAWCWGYNHNGHLGSGGTSDPVPYPAPVTGGHRFRWLAAGSQHTCGRTVDGRVYCWGVNSYGQLGVGVIYQSAVPVEVGSMD